MLEVLSHLWKSCFCCHQLSLKSGRAPGGSPSAGEPWVSAQWERRDPLHCRALRGHLQTSIHLTFPPHPGELFVGLLPGLGRGGDQVVIDVPLDPTPLGGIFSFFLKIGKRGKRNTLSSGCFSMGQSRECFLSWRKFTKDPFTASLPDVECATSVRPAGILHELKLSQSTWRKTVHGEKLSLQPIYKCSSAAEAGKCRDRATKMTWNLISLPVKYTGGELPSNIQCDNPHQCRAKLSCEKSKDSPYLQHSWEWDRTKEFCTSSVHGSMCRHTFLTGFLPFSPQNTYKSIKCWNFTRFLFVT